MNLPLTPERVRTLCAELGYTAKDEPLSQQKISFLEKHKPICACSNPGVFHVSGADWECASCHEKRLIFHGEFRHGELAARTIQNHDKLKRQANGA